MTASDVVIIGGTFSTKESDQALVQLLRRVHPATTWTTSVCTGAVCLAAVGILDGKDATTHWGLGPASWNAAAPATPSSEWWKREGDHRRRRVGRHRHGPDPSRPLV
jgi:putative intracellular protease/amidase